MDPKQPVRQHIWGSRHLTHLGQTLGQRILTRALEEVEAELGDDVHLCVKITYGYDC